MAISEVLEKLTDGSYAEKLKAANTLPWLKFKKSDINLLIDCVNQNPSNLFIRATILTAFQQAGPLAAEALPIMIDSLKESRDDIRRPAITAISALGHAGVAAAPSLLPLLDYPSETDRYRAVEALGKINTPTAVAIPNLVRMLGDESEQVKYFTIKALGDYGVRALDSIPKLSTIEQNAKSKNISWVAKHAIDKIRRSQIEVG